MYVLYAVAVARPGHGSIGPLSLGLAIFAIISAGGRPGLAGVCKPALGTQRLLDQQAAVQRQSQCCWRESSGVHFRHCDLYLTVENVQFMSDNAITYNTTCSGGSWLATALNPALVLANLIVFQCGAKAWIYLLGHAFGAALASVVSGSVFGFGGAYSDAEEAAGPRSEALLSQEPV